MKGNPGKTTIHLVAWICMRRMIHEPEVTQENVEMFPVQILTEYLGDLYEVQACRMNPSQYG